MSSSTSSTRSSSSATLPGHLGAFALTGENEMGDGHRAQQRQAERDRLAGGRANWNSMTAVTEAAITPMQRNMKMLVARAIPIRPYS